MVTDPIANMLISIKNAQAVGKTPVILQYSRIKEAIAKILADKEYLESVEVIEKDNRKNLQLHLGESRIISIRRISKPGNRRYRTAKKIPRPLRGQGLIIVSTSHGIMTGGQAARKGLGGEIICEVY